MAMMRYNQVDTLKFFTSSQRAKSVNRNVASFFASSTHPRNYLRWRYAALWAGLIYNVRGKLSQVSIAAKIPAHSLGQIQPHQTARNLNRQALFDGGEKSNCSVQTYQACRLFLWRRTIVTIHGVLVKHPGHVDADESPGFIRVANGLRRRRLPLGPSPARPDANSVAPHSDPPGNFPACPLPATP